MIVDTPEAFRAALVERDLDPIDPPTARGVLLVSPVGFHLDEQAASDNRYMEVGRPVSEARALEEHRGLAEAIASTLPTLILAGDPETPDAVFPNNVFATVPGRLIVGRMRHERRRREARRTDVRRRLGPALGYRTIDLSQRRDLVAELTGPLVLDRARRIGFVGLSERCDRAGAEAMHEAFGLALSFVFELAPTEYHTNVVMAILASRALVVHEGSFRDPRVPAAIAELYPGRTLWLSDEEKAAFAGNCIALSESEVWMSARAEAALSRANRTTLESWGFGVRSVPLDELEKAGGSLRCCVAEIF